MGTLRDATENELFQDYSSEMSELFGDTDVQLWRLNEGKSENNNDPLWDEYAPHPLYDKFELIGFFQQPERTFETDSPNPLNPETDTLFTVARDHLDKKAVPHDVFGFQIRAGDVIQNHSIGDVIFYDILNVNRRGWVNNSDQWTFLECELKRRDKFSPERKL